jgi:hypothetical protein
MRDSGLVWKAKIFDQDLVTADGGGIVPAPVVRHPALSAGFGGAGSLGGFKKAGLGPKSNMSSKLLALASRRVSAGRFHLFLDGLENRGLVVDRMGDVVSSWRRDCPPRRGP